MTEEDIDDVYAIECKSFSVPWSRNSFFELLRNPSAAFFCAHDAQGVSGYAGIFYLEGDGEFPGSAEVMNIAVRNDRRRCGIAFSLMTKLERFAAEHHIGMMMLEVRRSNESARNLYQLFGYREAGVRRKYYSKPTEDAILMNKIL